MADSTSLKYQPQITSLLIGVQHKDPRLYDLLHAMVNNTDAVSSILTRITGGSGGNVVPVSPQDFYDVLKAVSLRI